MNPTDAYRKELRKKELKRNKKERKKVREVGILKKDPNAIKEQIQKLETMKAEGALDKARKHKKRQLEDTYTLVMKKRREYEEKMKEKGETPVMFSHLGPPRCRAEDEERVNHPMPEDSVYYHPTLNPTGAPPPGKPPMYKSSIGSRVPLTDGSTSAGASTSNQESEDISAGEVPPPPPPPPLPNTNTLNPDGSVGPSFLPLPPPPPMPPTAAVVNPGLPLPPPPGPPPQDQAAIRPPLPPPPPLPRSALPPPPGTGSDDDSTAKDANQVPSVLPPPPPPPGMAPRMANDQPESASVPNPNNPSVVKDVQRMIPPPPPPTQQPLGPGPGLVPNLQADMLPPGIARFPPPPPPDMRAPLSALGLPGPPGMMVPLIGRPPYGPPPGPPPMMRPPLPPGPPPPYLQEDDPTYMSLSLAPQKPSYVKSAASTVVKRPLAQHQPELTSMVPASVRVRRETAAPKGKPKPMISSMTSTIKPAAPIIIKPESTTSSAAPKPQSIDDSYMAFLEDMKALGALEG